MFHPNLTQPGHHCFRFYSRLVHHAAGEQPSVEALQPVPTAHGLPIKLHGTIIHTLPPPSSSRQARSDSPVPLKACITAAADLAPTPMVLRFWWVEADSMFPLIYWDRRLLSGRRDRHHPVFGRTALVRGRLARSLETSCEKRLSRR